MIEKIYEFTVTCDSPKCGARLKGKHVNLSSFKNFIVEEGWTVGGGNLCPRCNGFLRRKR